MEGVMSSFENKVCYIIYKNGSAVMVSQEEWEVSWLKWWQSKFGQ